MRQKDKEKTKIMVNLRQYSSQIRSSREVHLCTGNTGIGLDKTIHQNNVRIQCHYTNG